MERLAVLWIFRPRNLVHAQRPDRRKQTVVARMLLIAKRHARKYQYRSHRDIRSNDYH